MKRSRVLCLLMVLAVSLCTADSLWAAAGDMVWPQPQTFNFQSLNPKYNTIDIFGIGASNNSIIVCGAAYDLNDSYPLVQLGFIKAFDQRDGHLRWDDYLTVANEPNAYNQNQFSSISILGNTVLVEGYACSYTVSPLINYSFYKSFLRAYNDTDNSGGTGSMLWEAPKIAAALNTGPQNIIIANNKVFVVRNEKGFYDSSGNTGNCIVEAYQIGAVTAPITSLLLQ